MYMYVFVMKKRVLGTRQHVKHDLWKLSNVFVLGMSHVFEQGWMSRVLHFVYKT